MTAYERCPHCHAVMGAMTNGLGGAYLQCMDCGYYEAVTRKPDPVPSERVQVQYGDGRTRTVLRSGGRPPRRVAKYTYTPESGLAALRALTTRLGRVPYRDELGWEDCPGESWFRRTFGSFNAAVRSAGLTPRRAGNWLGKNGRERVA